MHERANFGVIGNYGEIKMNIVLIGYRCCGKTSAGKIIAERLEKNFVDTDDLIKEKSGRSIDDIVSMYGWEHFRNIEKKVVREVSSAENQVIATGGGVIMNEENVNNLKEKGFLVWLYAGADIIKKRLKEDALTGENRPSLTGDDPFHEINKVMKQREPIYESASDIKVDTSSMTVPEVAELILKEIMQGRK